jgi:hypothetical protein
MEDKDCCVKYDEDVQKQPDSETATEARYYGLANKALGYAEPVCETSEYNFRYETKAFYANLVYHLIGTGLYGPADIQQIANSLVEDYKKI